MTPYSLPEETSSPRILPGSPIQIERQVNRNEHLENLQRNLRWEQQVSRTNLIATGARGAALRDPDSLPPLDTTMANQGEDDEDAVNAVKLRPPH